MSVHPMFSQSFESVGTHDGSIHPFPSSSSSPPDLVAPPALASRPCLVRPTAPGSQAQNGISILTGQCASNSGRPVFVSLLGRSVPSMGSTALFRPAFFHARLGRSTCFGQASCLSWSRQSACTWQSGWTSISSKPVSAP